MEFFRKSTVIFLEISGKIPPEISQLTTLVTAVNGTPSHSYRESLIIWHKWTMVMMMMIC